MKTIRIASRKNERFQDENRYWRRTKECSGGGMVTNEIVSRQSAEDIYESGSIYRSQLASLPYDDKLL